MDRTAAFYASPTYIQRGSGAIPIFSGSRRQRGGSILGAMKNFFMPLLQGVKNVAVRRAKSAALGLAKNVAQDVMSGRNLGSSLKTRGLQSVRRLGKDVLQDAVSHVKTTSRKRLKTPKKRKHPPAKRARKAENF